MEPGGAGVRPASGSIGRVRIEGGFTIEIAFNQPYAATAANIDGGIEDHWLTAPAFIDVRTVSTHDLIKARPSSLLFSGWNCVPQTLSWTTTLGNCSPYSDVAATSAGSSGSTIYEWTK